MKRFWIIFLAVLMLTACSSSVKPTNPQVKIETSAGQEFKLVIDSNPTTGYHWEIVGDLDKSVVDFVSKDYKSTSDPTLVGGGGVDIWVFKAAGAGETSITLGYYPPSNEKTQPAKTETFSVVVK
ncbi:MAG TPA: protease inhibitor I42 family protein [Anaerolineales bacterium]|nr:protease inhibitor I42 family protein [Anaerolineales bacterium]